MDLMFLYTHAWHKHDHTTPISSAVVSAVHPAGLTTIHTHTPCPLTLPNISVLLKQVGICQCGRQCTALLSLLLSTIYQGGWEERLKIFEEHPPLLESKKSWHENAAHTESREALHPCRDPPVETSWDKKEFRWEDRNLYLLTKQQQRWSGKDFSSRAIEEHIKEIHTTGVANCINPAGLLWHFKLSRQPRNRCQWDSAASLH